MPEAFTIGSFLISARAAAAVISILFAIWATGRIAAAMGARRRDAQKIMESSAWIGLVFARLGFVVMNWSAYAAVPWTALYFWQPGYSPAAGVIFGVAFALFRLWRLPAAEKKTMTRAVGGGFAAACLLLSAAIAMFVLLGDKDVLRRGDPVPDFTLQALNGDPVSLSSLRGNVVVLNFWATWCPPCRREMPLLDRIQDEYGKQGVQIVGVNLSEPFDLVRSYIESVGVDYPVWLDGPASDPKYSRTERLFEMFGGVGLPSTYFIGRDGILRGIRVGELSRGILQQGIDDALKRQ